MIRYEPVHPTVELFHDPFHDYFNETPGRMERWRGGGGGRWLQTNLRISSGPAQSRHSYPDIFESAIFLFFILSGENVVRML